MNACRFKRLLFLAANAVYHWELKWLTGHDWLPMPVIYFMLTSHFRGCITFVYLTYTGIFMCMFFPLRIISIMPPTDLRITTGIKVKPNTPLWVLMNKLNVRIKTDFLPFSGKESYWLKTSQSSFPSTIKWALCEESHHIFPIHETMGKLQVVFLKL